MTERLLCLLIGYLPGTFLTAELIIRKKTGKPAADLGTSGNPGMANVTAHLGIGPGLLVLAGDLGKCLLASALAWHLFHEDLGVLALLYAGLGVTLGHDFPFWNGFKGGKGVATTCMTVFLVHHVYGLICLLAGALLVLLTGYLCVGGAAIPLLFSVPVFLLYGREAGLVMLALALLMVLRNWKQLRLIPSGEAEKNDVLGGLIRRIRNWYRKMRETYNPPEPEPEAEAVPFPEPLTEEDRRIVRRHILFMGRVQGVGFRYQAQNAASQLGLTGWVRNLADGSVEAEVQGSEAAVRQFFALLGNNRWIQIRETRVEDIPLKEGEKKFGVTGYY